MKTIRFIGDVHGKINSYKWVVTNKNDNVDETIQIGDFAVGLQKLLTNEFVNNLPGYNRFIRGNHDNPELCKKFDSYIPDGTIENGILFIGGASSIDRNQRTEGVDWWRDEELKYSEFVEIMNKYEKERPNIVVTHECPEFLVYHLKPYVRWDLDKSITRQALQNIFDIHSPSIWVFGHHHMSYNNKIKGTQFICLDELEHLDLTI